MAEPVASTTAPDHKSLALALAAAGLPVFPCRERGNRPKSPYTDHGFKDATTDHEQLQRWWQIHPGALVGLPTGQLSGLSVIDCDTDEDGYPDGVAHAESLGLLDLATVRVRTPSGGMHLFFRHTDGAKSSAKQVAPNVDVRADGGYVIAPGCVLPDGNGYRYEGPRLGEAMTNGSLTEFPLDAVTSAIAAHKPPSRPPDHAKILHVDFGDTQATDDETRAVLRDLLASAPNDLDRPEWVKLAASLKVAFGDGLRPDFIDFSMEYGGSKPCDAAEADRVWRSAEPHTVTSIAPAFALLKSAVGEAGFRDAWRTEFRKRDKEDDRAVAQITRSAIITDEELPDLSHDALARELGTDGFDANARYVAKWNKWLFWEGTHWRTELKKEQWTRTRDFLSKKATRTARDIERSATRLEDADPKEARKLRNWAREAGVSLRHKTTIAAVEFLAQSNTGSASAPDEFDADLMLLGTPGGTVDLRTGSLRGAHREDMITKQTAIAPASTGSCPERWLSFLSEVFDGDQELINFMQRAAGYALTGLTSEHKLLFLHGTGRNGKSTLLDTLTWVLNDYTRRAAAETFLNTNGDKHATGLAGLQGARLVVGSELPVGKTWDEAVIKDLTGGDTISARYMRGDFFDFKPQLTLMIAGNNQPSFRGVDEAIRARVVLIPFTVTIPPERRDKDLADKLRAEGPEILRWAVDGALAWQERGLDVPASVVAASEEYMDDEDVLGQFLAEKTVASPDAFTSSTDLHGSFSMWCQNQGLNTWTAHSLTKELKTRGFKHQRRTKARGFLGIRLT